MLPYVLPVGPQNPSKSAVSSRSIGKPVPGDRAGAERIAVRALVRAFSRDAVALELFDDGQQIVRDGRRLRALRVGVHREHRVPVRVDQFEQRAPQLEARGQKPEDELALPHPVHRHVDVVAAARGVQPAGDVFDACTMSRST